jgi:hypothetical protein
MEYIHNMIKNYCEDEHLNKCIRILITGCSGSGKSNVLLNLIYDILEFDRLYFCAKDLSEPKYQKLIRDYTKYDAIDFSIEISKVKNRHDKALLQADYDKYKKETHFCSGQEDMISIDDLDPSYRNLVVFDDCITDKKQEKITEFFVRGRKKNATVIYLSQSYYATPITIRKNCYVFIFFRLQPRERNRILREIDGEFPKFHLKNPYDFIVLNTNSLTDRYQITNLEIN